MANDVSGFGLKVFLQASNTFPAGITITQFADDADPLDMPSLQIADSAMGLNGDLVTWARAQKVPLTLNVIPGSDDDINLAILAQANKVGIGRTSARDVITATVMYPDGTSTEATNGKITDAILGKPIASAGRMKTKPYIFAFEDAI